MLSLPALLIALAMVCFAALKNPGWGVIGFYFFAILDPEWNWRWAVPDDLRFFVGALDRGLGQHDFDRLLGAGLVRERVRRCHRQRDGE